MRTNTAMGITLSLAVGGAAIYGIIAAIHANDEARAKESKENLSKLHKPSDFVGTKLGHVGIEETDAVNATMLIGTSSGYKTAIEAERAAISTVKSDLATLGNNDPKAVTHGAAVVEFEGRHYPVRIDSSMLLVDDDWGFKYATPDKLATGRTIAVDEWDPSPGSGELVETLINGRGKNVAFT